MFSVLWKTDLCEIPPNTDNLELDALLWLFPYYRQDWCCRFSGVDIYPAVAAVDFSLFLFSHS